jgi:hypothetical protein
MDGEPLRWLYHRLLHDHTLTRTPGCTYGDGVVCFVYFLGVLNGHSLLWASDKHHWPAWCRRIVRIPCHQQLYKRLKTASVVGVIDSINAELRDRLPRGRDKTVDGKALIIGGYSHDPDAAVGRVPDGWGCGYKLHAVVDARGGAIDAAEVTPLDAGEATVLRHALIPRVALAGCTLHGDANYDSNPCYAAVADAGGRMIAPRRKPRTGLGHGIEQHPDRLRAVDELERSPDHAAALAIHRRLRNRVEQAFALLTNLPFGLAPLPNHVRRLPRVRLWVKAKITLYHLHKYLILPAIAAA